MFASVFHPGHMAGNLPHLHGDDFVLLAILAALAVWSISAQVWQARKRGR